MIETSTCPACGGVIEKGDRFCQECGRAVPAVAATSAESLLDKLHAFRAELILIGAVITFALSVVCWTDGARLKEIAHAPASWFAAMTKQQPKEPKNQQQLKVKEISTAHGASARDSQTSELQQLFSKSHTLATMAHPSAGTAPAAMPLASRPAAMPLASRPAAMPPHAVAAAATTALTVPANKHTVVSAPTPDKRQIAARLPAQEPAADLVGEANEKSPKADPKAIADVAEYNRLLADYFARKKNDGQVADTAGEPPSYQEWIAGRKPLF